VPVETDGDGRSGDSVYGGRLSQGVLGLYRVGLSYLKEKNDKGKARDEAGLDLWVQPHLPVVLSGSSLYNTDTKDFARHAYSLAFEPRFARGARLTALYSFTNYKAFFTGTDNSPFLFPAIDPNERLRTLGAELMVPVAGGLTLTGDFTNYDYTIAAKADRYGARADWSGEGGMSAGLGFHRCQGDAAENRYSEVAAYAGAHVGPAKLSLDLRETLFAEKINGTKNAFTATLAADAGITPSLTVGADLAYGSNPDYSSEVRAMLKLIWRYALDTAAKGGAAK
jgi:hypothetical protein